MKIKYEFKGLQTKALEDITTGDFFLVSEKGAVLSNYTTAFHMKNPAITGVFPNRRLDWESQTGRSAGAWYIDSSDPGNRLTFVDASYEQLLREHNVNIV